MNTKSILAITTAAALCAGCVGTGPNTQNGAVAGGALGALAGAIIGNNSGGHNALGGAAIGAVAGAIAGGTLGNAVDHQNGTIYHSSTRRPRTSPWKPCPRLPRPRPRCRPRSRRRRPSGSTGTTTLTGTATCWVPGHWEIPPPNASPSSGPTGGTAAAPTSTSGATGADGRALGRPEIPDRRLEAAARTRPISRSHARRPRVDLPAGRVGVEPGDRAPIPSR
jgi:hypothetical protein